MENINVTTEKPKKITKKLIIKMAVICVSVGLLICLLVFAFTGFNIYALSREKFEKKVYEDDHIYQNYEILTENDNIEFKISDNDKLRIEYYDSNLVTHNMLKDRTNDNTLTVSSDNHKKWYDYIGTVSIETPKMTIYLPEKNCEKITVDTTNGAITVNDVNAKRIELFSTNGSVTVDGCKSDNYIGLHTTNGTVTAKNTIIKDTGGQLDFSNENLYLETVNGSIRIDNCDAAIITADTVNGGITGKISRKMHYITSTVNGDVMVPGPPLGYDDYEGMCSLSTVNGDIHMK